jgi:hypothetical protein
VVDIEVPIYNHVMYLRQRAFTRESRCNFRRRPSVLSKVGATSQLKTTTFNEIIHRE